MSSQYPTIKHFYSTIATPSNQTTPSRYPSPTQPSPSENALASSPPPHDATLSTLTQWAPPQPYTLVNISSLSPGPRFAAFTCRITNIYDQPIESKMPQSAKGCLKLLVKDDTAILLIKLWYASPTTYALRLGTLLTVWTTHIHSTSTLTGLNDTTAKATLPAAPIMTSIFPERDGGCHVQVHEEEGKISAYYRTPLGGGNSLNGIMSLDTYINHNGSDMPDARLLVCVVAVGEPVSLTTHSSPSTTFTTIECTITDALTQTTLSLSTPLFSSARSWTRNHTILLLSSPRLRGNRLTLTPRSHVEIDPNVSAATSLRRIVQRANAPINCVFPWEMGQAHVQEMEKSSLRLQFTFSSLCDFIDDGDAEADADTGSSSKLNSETLITGYLSTILTQINLTELVRRKMLFSMPCCGMPVYSNAVRGTCGQCALSVQLRVNPDLVGGMADETGGLGIAISSSGYGSGYVSNNSNTRSPTSKNQQTLQNRHSPLLWSDTAWTQLLGRTAEELAEFCLEDSTVSATQKRENANVLRYLEQRLLWMRVVLLVGWMGEVDGGGWPFWGLLLERRREKAAGISAWYYGM